MLYYSVTQLEDRCPHPDLRVAKLGPQQFLNFACIRLLQQRNKQL